MRGIIIIVGSLAMLFVAGFFLERSAYFEPLRQSLNSITVNTAMLQYGPMGETLAELGLIRIVPNDSQDVVEAISDSKVELSDNVFQKKRRVGKNLFQANPDGYQGMPSSQVIDANDLVTGYPLLSIVAEDEDLYNSESGIISNATSRGRVWEKPAYVSYYDENGVLAFATGAGLRMHGGSSRRVIKKLFTEQGAPAELSWHRRPSFRLYFRGEYGSKQFKPGVLFGPETDPLKTIVVRFEKSKSWPFRMCLLFDIVNEIGAIAPASKPALCYLNGEPLGAFFISGHLSPRQWASHFGHKNFAFHSYKGKSEEASELEYKKILRWCMDTRRKISMEEASKYIDLDNLTRYIFAVIYCGTSDGFQGAAMLDTSKPGSKWFWVNWDMDATSLGDPWKRGAWKWGFSRKGCSDVQSIIFTRLVSECPQYCEYLVPLVVDTLNHRINQKFLKSRIEYYDQLAMAYGINEKSFQSDKPFFKERADCVMKEMRYIKQLNVGEYLTCKVAGPANLEYDIDGYSEQAGYQGKYFKGMSIRVEITSEHNNQLSHWLVNGKRLTGDILEYPIVVDTVIEPILVDYLNRE